MRGFTLIEMLMAIVLVGILAVVSIDYFQDDIDEVRFESTKVEMEKIKVALIGDENKKINGKRVDFGYIGDVGAVPSSINDLITNPALPVYAVDATNFIGYGWRGPYLKDTTGAEDFTRDAWGNLYTTSFATDPLTITSLGSDGAAGGSGFATDLTLSIPSNRYRGQVDGFITQIGTPFTGNAEIQLFTTTAGTLSTSSTAISGTNGHFSFSNVYFGERSVKASIPSIVTPETVIGPVPVTIDSNFSSLPENALVYTASELGGCTDTTDITYVSGSVTDSKSDGTFGNPTSQHKFIRLKFNLAEDFTSITLVTVTSTSGKISGVKFEARAQDACTIGGGCSTTAGAEDPITIAAYDPAVPLTNKDLEIEFRASMHAAFSISVKMEYTSPSVPYGCSTINFSSSTFDHSTTLDN